jgi:hypothetical protein
MGISSALGSQALLPAGLGFRNLLINGDMRIWQRGTSSIAASLAAYSADRWYAVQATINSARDATQQTFTPGELQNHGQFYLRHNVTVAGSTTEYCRLEQRIENVRTCAGNSIVVSFFAKAQTDGMKVAIGFNQNFGTGGSPSSEVYTYATSHTLTTSWARYTAVVNIPSITGKTIGTNNNDYLGLVIWQNAGSNFNSQTGSLGNQTGFVDFWGVQVEQNYQPTPFEQRPIGVELALCQRYYEDSVTTVGQAGSYAAGLGGNTYCSGTYFKVPKRIAPSSTNGANDTPGNIRLWDNTGVAGRVSLYRGGWGTTTTATIDWSGTWGFNLTTTGSTTDAAMVAFRWAFSAEL